jgi:hypothetical protein
MRRTILLLTAGLFLAPLTLSATIINLGVVSFDNLIPDGASPGVNVFDIGLYTGALNSLPPDFPDVSETSLLNAVLTVDEVGGVMDQFDLGTISPGVFTPPSSIQFATTVMFTDATLTATLDNPVFTLSDGSTFTAASADISATILPSSGSTLQAGTDLAIITTTDTPSATPEPGTLALAGFAAAILVLARVRTVRNGARL